MGRMRCAVGQGAVRTVCRDEMRTGGVWLGGDREQDGRRVGDGRVRSDGRRPQSTWPVLALDGWRDYGNTDGRLRAMTDGAPQSVRTVLALNGRRDRRTD